MTLFFSYQAFKESSRAKIVIFPLLVKPEKDSPLHLQLIYSELKWFLDLFHIQFINTSLN